MRKPLGAFLISAAVFFGASRSQAAITLPNLPNGSQYQLIFTTTDSTSLTSATLASVNTFANTEAAENPALPATTWHAVLSDTTTNASVNAPSLGLPIYNTLGQLVATGGTGLYTASLLTTIDDDQFGNTTGIGGWTGSNTSGAALHPLGSGTEVEIGYPFDTDSTWISQQEQFTGAGEDVYALSGAITVVPEPASLALLGLVGMVVLSRRPRWMSQLRTARR